VAGKRKEEIITFKVDEGLSRLLSVIPNRSNFIRNAILMAVENICPLCQGTGVMTPDQRDRFSQNHKLQECTDCHAVHLTCESR